MEAEGGFALPPYLLKTPYGENLQKQLVQPSPSRQQLSQTTQLSTAGIMGSMPGRFSESGYDEALVSMLSTSPVVSNVAARRQSRSADLEGDSSMRDVSIPTSNLRIVQGLDVLDSIHYSNDLMDVDGAEDEERDDDDDDEGDEDALDLRDIDGSLIDSTHSSHTRHRRRSSVRGSRTLSRGPLNLNSFKYPLPLKWVTNSNTQLISSDNGLGLKVESVRTTLSNTMAKSYDYHSAKADAIVHVHTGVFYFEVRIVSATNNNNKGCCDVSIGFMNSSVGNVTKMAGLESGTYGFNGHDGSTTANQTVTRRYSRKFGQGDVIGCGVNFSTKMVFYTKNGVYLGPAFKDVNKSLVPIISMKAGNSIMTNFGMQPFVFDIEGYIDQEKMKVSQKVLDYSSSGHTSTVSTVDPATDMDLRVNTNTDKEIPALMQRLVASYFDHLGYVDISKTFADEVRKERLETGSSGSAGSSGDNEMKDADSGTQETHLKVRQQIRKSLLDGDVDSAIKLTNVHFPKVFEEHEEILFKLFCNKFIQLIKHSHIDDAIMFGQSLREKYNSNFEYQEFLNDIFSLLAYEDPESSEFGYLLKEDETLKISDDLNSEILTSLGKSSVSDLEKLVRHTKALLKVCSESKGQLDTLLLTNEDFGL